MKVCFFLLVVMLVFTLVSGCNNIDISKYSGDGEIEKIGKWPFSSGYIISFDQILLNRNYSKEFILKDIPLTKKNHFFGVMIQVESSVLDQLKNGQLHMKAYSEKREVFFDISEKLIDWRFSKSFVDNSEVKSFVFYLDRALGSDINSTQLEKVDELRFIVQLDGADENPPIEGIIQMRVGGFK